MLELTRKIHDLIEVEAREALTSGWAELRIEDGEIGPSLHLEPVKLDSAPLEIFFDSEELVICSPGRKGMTCEFFEQDPARIEARVQALAAAVVAGSYAERMRSGTSELVGEWPGPEGTEKAVREALISSGLGSSEWIPHAYEPY